MTNSSASREHKASVASSPSSCYQCTIQELCNLIRTRTGNLLAFVGTDDEKDQRSLQQSLELPSAFWSPMLQKSSGLFRARERTDESGELISYDTWFRFLVKMPRRETCRGENASTKISYDWYKFCFFTRWQPDGKSLILAFDLPSFLQQEFHDLGLDSIELDSPFAAHTLILDRMCPTFDRAVWACRDLVRAHEKNRPSAERPQPEYEDLHEIARHAIHSTEMLATAINVVEAMIQESRSHSVRTTLSEREAERSLRYHKTLLQGFHLRSQALESRLGNEMNLTFHVNAQYDSVVQGKIAQSAQADSAAMRTISFLGLVFLPGTFISAIFSMSFFDFSPPNNATQQFRMSSSFWIFWAVSVPVTLVTILLWTLWYRSVQAAGATFPLLAGKGVKKESKEMQTEQWTFIQRLQERRLKKNRQDIEMS